MSDSVGVEEDVYSPFDEYCDSNGISKKFAASRAIEDWMDEQESDE